MNRISRAVALCVLTLLMAPHGAWAQSATAAGLGNAAAGEARGPEAVLFNPALAVFGDGASLRILLPAPVLGFSDPDGIRTFLNARNEFTARDSSYVPPQNVLDLASWTGKDIWVSSRASIFGIGTDNFLFLVENRLDVDLRLPDRFPALLAGDSLARVTRPQDSERPARSVHQTRAHLARGWDVGVLPLVGPTWIGAGVSLTFVHRHGYGSFDHPPITAVPRHSIVYMLPGEYALRYQETVIRNHQRIGLDVGFLAQPAPWLVVSAAVQNLADAGRGGDELYVRTSLTGDSPFNEPALHSVSYRSTLSDEGEHVAGREWLKEANRQRPRFRGSVSSDTWFGRWMAGVNLPLDPGPSLDVWKPEQWSVAWMLGRGPLQPRVSFGETGDAQQVLRGGLEISVACQFLTLGAEHWSDRRSWRGSVGWTLGRGCSQ